MSGFSQSARTFSLRDLACKMVYAGMDPGAVERWRSANSSINTLDAGFYAQKHNSNLGIDPFEEN